MYALSSYTLDKTRAQEILKDLKLCRSQFSYNFKIQWSSL